MLDWNVVVNVNERGFGRAFQVLGEFGDVAKTGFYNVLVMKSNNISVMLETLRGRSLDDPAYLSFLSRLIPVANSFSFQTPEEFEQKAKDIVLARVPELAGKSFHVRMHRRGFKGKISSIEEEKFLDTALLDALEKTGLKGHMTFTDPDAIIAVESVGQRAGISFWSREDLQRYPFIRLEN